MPMMKTPLPWRKKGSAEGVWTGNESTPYVETGTKSSVAICAKGTSQSYRDDINLRMDEEDCGDLLQRAISMKISPAAFLAILCMYLPEVKEALCQS